MGNSSFIVGSGMTIIVLAETGFISPSFAGEAESVSLNRVSPFCDKSANGSRLAGMLAGELLPGIPSLWITRTDSQPIDTWGLLSVMQKADSLISHQGPALIDGTGDFLTTLSKARPAG